MMNISVEYFTLMEVVFSLRQELAWSLIITSDIAWNS